jgi:hypothetical protein
VGGESIHATIYPFAAYSRRMDSFTVHGRAANENWPDASRNTHRWGTAISGRVGTRMGIASRSGELSFGTSEKETTDE